MLLRCRWPPSDAEVSLSDDATLHDLLVEVEKITKLDRTDFTVRTGFPPSDIKGGDDSPLSSIDLQQGDLITVIRNTELGQQAHSSARVPKRMVVQAQNINSRSSVPPPASEKVTPKGRKRCASVPAAPPSCTASYGTRIHSLTNNHGESSPPEGGKKKKMRSLNWGGSQEEWAVGLVETFNKSGGSAAEKMIKKAFKGAVQRRAESTLAEQRWAAAQGKIYTLTSSGATFEVTFPTGKRKTVTETYSSLPHVLLAAIIREVYSSGGESRENLRPYYVAEAHPMVFWNVIRCFDGEYFSALREMVPEVDWSFTEDRRRFLSEKALHNLRQQEEEAALRLSRERFVGTTELDESQRE